MVVTGGLYLLAAVAFRLTPVMSRSESTSVERRGVWVEAWEGLCWMAAHPQLRVLVGISALANFAYMIPFSILVLFARDQLGLSASGYGLLLSVSALGGLVGAAAAPMLHRSLGYRNALASSLALGAATLIALSFTTNAVLAGALVGGGLAQIANLAVPVLVGGCAFLIATLAIMLGWPEGPKRLGACSEGPGRPISQCKPLHSGSEAVWRPYYRHWAASFGSTFAGVLHNRNQAVPPQPNEIRPGDQASETRST